MHFALFVKFRLFRRRQNIAKHEHNKKKSAYFQHPKPNFRLILFLDISLAQPVYRVCNFKHLHFGIFTARQQFIRCYAAFIKAEFISHKTEFFGAWHKRKRKYERKHKKQQRQHYQYSISVIYQHKFRYKRHCRIGRNRKKKCGNKKVY